jgi:hypothetical protein
MTTNYTKMSVSQLKQTAKTKGINWLKPSQLRKSDLVAVLESQDTLAAAGEMFQQCQQHGVTRYWPGKDPAGLPAAYSKKTTPELLAMLAEKNVKWIYKSKGVKKGDLAALLHRLDTGDLHGFASVAPGDWEPSNRKEPKPSGPMPRFWEKNDGRHNFWF